MLASQHCSLFSLSFFLFILFLLSLNWVITGSWNRSLHNTERWSKRIRRRRGMGAKQREAEYWSPGKHLAEQCVCVAYGSPTGRRKNSWEVSTKSEGSHPFQARILSSSSPSLCFSGRNLCWGEGLKKNGQNDGGRGVNFAIELMGEPQWINFWTKGKKDAESNASFKCGWLGIREWWDE